MNKIFIALISVFLIISAYFRLPEISQYDSKRIFQLLLFLLIGIAGFFSLIKNLKEKRNFTSKRLLLGSKFTVTCLGVILLAGLISVLLASNGRYALLEFSFSFLLLTLVYLIAPSTLKQHHLLGSLIFSTALIFSSIYMVIFLGNYISSFFNPMIALWPEKYNFILTIDGVDLKGKEVLYFDNKRFFNHTQTWTLPLLVGLLTYLQKQNYEKIIRGLLFLLTACWWMLLFVTTGRGAIFGIVVSLILLAVIWRKDVYAFVKNTVLSLSAGGVLYYVMFILPVDKIGQTIFRIESSRPFRFLGALEVWWQNPLFGLGPMHYAQIGKSQFVGHPHNFYLQFLSEWGIFAFIALACLAVTGMIFIYKNYSKTKEASRNRIIYITLTWSLLAGLIHAFFSGVMMTPMSQMWFVLIVAWFLGYGRKIIADNVIGIRFNYLTMIYVFFLIIVLWMVSYDIFNLTEIYEKYLTDYPHQSFKPRFWVQGLFE